MHSREGIPDTWKALLRHDATKLEVSLELLASLPESIELESVASDLGSSLGSVAEILAATMLSSGLDCAESEWKRIDALWPGVIPGFRAVLERREVTAPKGALEYINVSQCAGRVVPAEAIALVEPTLERLTKLLDMFSRPERYRVALAALAFGRPDLVPTFSSGGKLPKSFKPGQKFGFNLQGFTRYLAVGMNHGASAEDVEPAWSEFVALFPLQLASESLEWVDLFAAARAVMVHFEKLDVAEVAQELHDLVQDQE